MGQPAGACPRAAECLRGATQRAAHRRPGRGGAGGAGRHLAGDHPVHPQSEGRLVGRDADHGCGLHLCLAAAARRAHGHRRHDPTGDRRRQHPRLPGHRIGQGKQRPANGDGRLQDALFRLAGPVPRHAPGARAERGGLEPVMFDGGPRRGSLRRPLRDRLRSGWRGRAGAEPQVVGDAGVSRPDRRAHGIGPLAARPLVGQRPGPGGRADFVSPVVPRVRRSPRTGEEPAGVRHHAAGSPVRDRVPAAVGSQGPPGARLRPRSNALGRCDGRLGRQHDRAGRDPLLHPRRVRLPGPAVGHDRAFPGQGRSAADRQAAARSRLEPGDARRLEQRGRREPLAPHGGRRQRSLGTRKQPRSSPSNCNPWGSPSRSSGLLRPRMPG